MLINHNDCSHYYCKHWQTIQSPIFVYHGCEHYLYAAGLSWDLPHENIVLQSWCLANLLFWSADEPWLLVGFEWSPSVFPYVSMWLQPSSSRMWLKMNGGLDLDVVTMCFYNILPKHKNINGEKGRGTAHVKNPWRFPMRMFPWTLVFTHYSLNIWWFLFGKATWWTLHDHSMAL